MANDPRDTPVQPVQPVQPVAVAPVASRRTSWTRTFTIAAALAGIVAIALIVIGAVALARTGLDGPLNEPVVEVAGFTQNAALGIMEIAAGVLLLVAALSQSRGAILFFSIVIGIGAVVAWIEPTVGDLPIERSFAAIVAIAAAIVAVTAAVVPSVRRTTQYVEPI